MFFFVPDLIGHCFVLHSFIVIGITVTFVTFGLMMILFFLDFAGWSCVCSHSTMYCMIETGPVQTQMIGFAMKQITFVQWSASCFSSALFSFVVLVWNAS